MFLSRQIGKHAGLFVSLTCSPFGPVCLDNRPARHWGSTFYGATMPRTFPSEELLQDLKHVAEIVDRPPTNRDYREHGRFSWCTITKRFVGWERALHLAGFERDSIEWSVDILTPEQGGWIAGFSSGEACFHMGAIKNKKGPLYYRCHYLVNLRADDEDAIKYLCHLWNIDNKIAHKHYRNSNRQGYISKPYVGVDISDIPTLYHKVVATFRRYPLMSKKQKDFEIFAIAVEIMNKRYSEYRKGFPLLASERSQLDELYHQLRKVKKYIG